MQAEPAEPVVHTATAVVGSRTVRCPDTSNSTACGLALSELAHGRPYPIPFYGELGSLNPVVVTPGALATHGADIVAGFVGSYTLAGQFCTKPGLLFRPKKHALDDALAATVEQAAASLGPMLNDRIRDRYEATAGRLSSAPGVRELVTTAPADEPGYPVGPMLAAVSAADLLADPDTLLVEYGSEDELVAALGALPGSLTATLHADADTETDLAGRILDRFAQGAGRVVWAGWPTGVAVTWTMQHGGPWPSTTAPLHTSVGVAAMRRFLRPAAYQNVPDPLLPEALRAVNPLRIPRRVNGALS